MTTTHSVNKDEVYYSAARNCMVDLVRSSDGTGLESKLTFEQLKARDPDIQRMSLDEGWRRLCNSAIKAPREISEAEYTEKLHELPPLNWRGGTFMYPELCGGDIAHIFCRIGDRYFRMQDSRFLTPIEIMERCRPLLSPKA